MELYIVKNIHQNLPFLILEFFHGQLISSAIYFVNLSFPPRFLSLRLHHDDGHLAFHLSCSDVSEASLTNHSPSDVCHHPSF